MIISNDTLEDIIRKEYLKDKQAQRVLAKLTEDFEKINNRLILFKELVYVLKHQQNNIIRIYHDDSLREHWGVHKIIKAISWSYYFSHMWKKVQDYVNKCNLCHKIKLSRHKSYEKIRTVSTLNQLWASVVINFIIKLLLSKMFLTKVIYNLILTIVNQLMKKVRFLSYKEVSDTEELTYTFLQNVTAL